MAKIAVLMSTYNGEKYVRKQIDSLLNQSVFNDVDLIIRDDGSSDDTVKIIEEYKRKYKNIKLTLGENVGFVKSFWSLIQCNEGYDYYALCDQDDVWEPYKIEKAVQFLQSYDSVPALYTCNLSFINQDGDEISMQSFEGKVPNNYEVFQRSVIPGCTFVFNSMARNIVKEFNGRMYSHDWAIYAIVKTFGEVYFEEEALIKYRIHGNNTIGAKNRVGKMAEKVKNFFKKSPNTRSKFAKDFYETYYSILPAFLKDDVYMLGYYRENKLLKRKLIFNNHFKGIIFKVYVILNRV